MPTKPRTPGRRFFLPPGYSLGLEVKGKAPRFYWTRPGAQSDRDRPFADPEAATGAAWDDAGLTRPGRLSEPV